MKEETTNIDAQSKLDWHTGFEGGLRLSLRNYAYYIDIEREHYLSSEPLRIDFLVIKKNAGAVIDNAIGRGFLGHNIIEYKNPNDELNIDVLWKVIGYAALYKSFGESVDQIKITDITISILRAIKPVKLFRDLTDAGKNIVQEYPGVYAISDLIEIPVRIIVTDELEDSELMAFSVMSQNASEEEIRQFVQEASMLKEPGYRRNADAVLQISANLHKDLYGKLKGDDTMCDALRELMADDLKEAENKGAVQGRMLDRIEMICGKLSKGLDAATIADHLDLPIDQVNKIIEASEKYAPDYDAEKIYEELTKDKAAVEA